MALYEFQRTSPNDLQFTKNERLTIVDSTDDPNWVRARNNSGQEGLIPTNYVTTTAGQQINSLTQKGLGDILKPKWELYK